VIENMIAKKVDAISIAVLDIPGMTPIIQKAMNAGIPVTCFNVDAPESGRLGFVGEDLFVAGAATAKTLIKHMGTKGKINVHSVALGAIWSIKREEGVMSVLKDYPDIEIVDRLNCSGDEQAQYAALENSLLAHPELTGAISFGGTQFVFSRLLEAKGIGNAKSKKPIYNTGHDLYEEKLIQIQNGWSTAAFGQNPYEQGYQAVKQLVELLVDGKVPTVIDTGVIEVDSSNVDKYLQMLYDGEPVG
jgi:ribose transport system substrate-binding protein